MLPFQTILFAADFSERSRGAHAVARLLARCTHGRLIVFHAVVPVLFGETSGPPGTAGLPPFLPSDTPSHRAELTDRLREWYPPADAVETEYRVEHGDAAEAILRAARDRAADVIAMGTHGRSGLDRLIVGSVAESVLQGAECPVLVFRSPVETEAEPEAEPGPFRSILVPTDASDGSRAAVRVARSLAQAAHAPLVLLHVISPHDKDGPETHRQALQALKAEIEGDGSGVSVEVRTAAGDPAAEIVRGAGELGCDLIVMGSHGRTGLAHLVMGSVAEHVVREAACPTLVVKQGRPA